MDKSQEGTRASIAAQLSAAGLVIASLALVGALASALHSSEVTSLRFEFPFWLPKEEDLSRYGTIRLVRQEARDEEARIHEILDRYTLGVSAARKEQLTGVILDLSKQHQIPSELVIALIGVESSFRNWSVSPKGAVGLMQIMPSTAHAVAVHIALPYLGNHELYDPYVNIHLGVGYLRMLRDWFGDMDTALAAYNHGPTRIASLLSEGSPIPGSYSRKVIDGYNRLLESSAASQARLASARTS